MSRGTGTVRELQCELESTIDHKNTVRSFVMSAVLLLLTPVYIVVVGNAGTYENSPHGFKAFLVAFAIFQAAMAAAGFFIILRNETDWQKTYYRTVYGASLVLLAVTAAFEKSATGSMLAYIAVSVMAVIVPVLDLTEQTVIMGMMSDSAVVSAVAFRLPGRNILDISVWCVATAVSAMFIQSRAEDYERVSIKLKNQTATSEKDHLTGLANRRALDKNAPMLWRCCERASAPVGIIEIDIDFFKKYNDKFGHPEGDECLRKIASAIGKSAQRCSDIVARTGGEEFIVLAQNMNHDQIVALALKIRNAVLELKLPHAYMGVSKYVTVSIGAAQAVPSFDNSFQNLYKEADDALYQAKENGRNCIVCNGKIYGRMKNGVASAI